MTANIVLYTYMHTSLEGEGEIKIFLRTNSTSVHSHRPTPKKYQREIFRKVDDLRQKHRKAERYEEH